MPCTIHIPKGFPVEKAIRLFKKQVEKAGILGEVRKREAYDKPSVKRKKKEKAAQKRLLKKLRTKPSYR